jgi:ferritin-like metal-binding protein YciE
MENMNQLRDLLRHEINDLYSAEEQIIEALPLMIEKAKDTKLKKALNEHLEITEEQKVRLDEVLLKLDQVASENGQGGKPRSGGFLSGLFGDGRKVCKGMQGLIMEGNKLMAEDMSSDVMDAAIIASAQKIEHYEISSYGTARAYAQELELDEVEQLLKETLDEEYEADNLLTELAVGRLNKEAVSRRRRKAQSSSTKKNPQKRSSAKKTAGNSKNRPGKKRSGKKATSR